MYEKHPSLDEPPEETTLWRYMNLAKFMSLLETESLHFSILRSFLDPYEGRPPRRFVEDFTNIPANLSQEEFEQKRNIAQQNLNFFSSSRDAVCASCWQMNPAENAGMWSQYVNNGDGIAVRTTFSRLKSSIQPNSQTQISGAIVKYVDFETIETPEANVLAWAALKRNAFEHEREFRLLALTPGIPLKIKVDLDSLIEELIVAPNIPEWFFDLIAKIAYRYQIKAPIRRSKMLDGPHYLNPP